MRVLEFRVEIWWAKCLSSKDADGRTPLHYCVSAGHDRSVLEALICVRGDTTTTTTPSAFSSNQNHHTSAQRKNPKSDMHNLQKSMSRSSISGGGGAIITGSHESLRSSNSGGGSGVMTTHSVPSRGGDSGGDPMMMVERGRGRFYDDNPGEQTNKQLILILTLIDI